MGLVNDHQIPPNLVDLHRLFSRKLVGTDNDIIPFKGMGIPLSRQVVIGFRFEDTAWQEELLLHFLVPLFAEIGRGDDQDLALSFGPFLREDKSSLDCFAQADFIREHGPS